MGPLVGAARLIVEDRLKAALGPHRLLFQPGPPRRER
jgi:hypothetical protein